MKRSSVLLFVLLVVQLWSASAEPMTMAAAYAIQAGGCVCLGIIGYVTHKPSIVYNQTDIHLTEVVNNYDNYNIIRILQNNVHNTYIDQRVFVNSDHLHRFPMIAGVQGTFTADQNSTCTPSHNVTVRFDHVEQILTQLKTTLIRIASGEQVENLLQQMSQMHNILVLQNSTVADVPLVRRNSRSCGKMLTRVRLTVTV